MSRERLQRDVHKRGQPVKPYYIQEVKDSDINRHPLNECWGYNEDLDYNFLIPDMAQRRNEFYEEIRKKKEGYVYNKRKN